MYAGVVHIVSFRLMGSFRQLESHLSVPTRDSAILVVELKRVEIASHLQTTVDMSFKTTFHYIIYVFFYFIRPKFSPQDFFKGRKKNYKNNRFLLSTLVTPGCFEDFARVRFSVSRCAKSRERDVTSQSRLRLAAIGQHSTIVAVPSIPVHASES